MLPKVIHLIIKHFDSIHRVVSKRLVRKRPWQEPALTSLLADLLDQEVQEEEKIEYTINQLNDDLKNINVPYNVKLNIETHQYKSKYENLVGQADIGLIIDYKDEFFPQNSWSRPWLLQAKRVMPVSFNPLVYDETASFSSFSKAQHDRITKLSDVIGEDFVRYLLYCPRSEDLDITTAAKLAHLRNSSLCNHIFDYAIGFEIKSSLESEKSTLDAGVFISVLNAGLSNLAYIHSTILHSNAPLSWFIVSHFAHGTAGTGLAFIDRTLRSHQPSRADTNRSNSSWVEGIVRGNPAAIEKLFTALNIEESSNIPMLPSHTITVEVTSGAGLDPELARIRGIDA